MAMCRRIFFHYDLIVYTELQVLSKTASRLWFYAEKSTRTVTLQDNILTMSHPAFHNPERKWQFQFGNIWKITTNSNFQSHFLNGWSYRRVILQNNLEDQA